MTRAGAAFVFLWGLLGFAGCASPTSKDHRTIEYSYQTGCYQAYQRICGKLSTDEKRGACRDEGLESCEKLGRDFGSWVRAGKTE